jgi:hypothetical protein
MTFPFTRRAAKALCFTWHVARLCLLAALLAPAAHAQNYSDIWWNPAESGWGLTIADHESQLFAVWYTYRQDGSPTWLVIPGGTFSSGRRLFTGDLYETTGPPFSAAFDPARVTRTVVGRVTLDFAPPALVPGTALFSYVVGAVSHTKQIQRQSFGDASPAWGSDFTDIWWDANESGWGLTLAQHGNNVFAVWYTYDPLGRPLFLVVPGVTFTGLNSFSGDLYATTGPYYGIAPFDPDQVQRAVVGRTTITFDPAPGALKAAPSRATFVVTAFDTSRTKAISRQPFGNAAPSVPVAPATYQLLVARTGDGEGSVTSSPPGIACGTGGACVATFARSSVVTLTATPASGSRFSGFSGTCSSSAATCIVSMGGQASVSARFDRLPPASTLSIDLHGLPPARAGTPYSELAATGSGGVPPYHFQSDTFANGTPPPGMVVTLAGYLQGTPSSAITSTTTYTFGICVVDSVGSSDCNRTSVQVDPAAPVQDGTIAWTIGNQCNNGQQVDYKFFDRVHDWVWPSPTSHYYISYGQTVSNRLNCVSGANICLGARSGSYSWGVGIAGTSGCSNCCGTCDGRTYAYTFGCPSAPGTFYYANWSCGGSSQCASLMGGYNGSTGPFCTLSSCQAWGNQYISAGYSCSTTPTYTPNPGGSNCQ